MAYPAREKSAQDVRQRATDRQKEDFFPTSDENSEFSCQILPRRMRTENTMEHIIALDAGRERWL